MKSESYNSIIRKKLIVNILIVIGVSLAFLLVLAMSGVVQYFSVNDISLNRDNAYLYTFFGGSLLTVFSLLFRELVKKKNRMR